jgi:hypothetical protein
MFTGIVMVGFSLELKYAMYWKMANVIFDKFGGISVVC